MINIPNGLKDSEVSLYIAAFERCEESIKEKNNNTTVDETVDEIVAQWGKIVENAEQLRTFLLAEVKVPINPVVAITDVTVKNKKWFSELKKNQSRYLEYWRRYYDYLNRKPSWTLDAVRDIDDSTDAVLNYMADPNLKIKQDVYGLAFGYVQSGKTAHYLGVLNKAADAGYKIIIVLAGIHNNLRSQTQIRLEEEFLGYDVRGLADDSQNAIGVGIGRSVSHHFSALTSREEKGDFNKIKAGTSMNPPFILVTKKNASVLAQLIRYLRNLPVAVKKENGKKGFSVDYPLLVIDDEADQASLNTKDCFNADGTVKEDFNPTTINKHIRTILSLFDCFSYVGYTATPFANIFIPPKINSRKYGKDLFPKDFIVNIPRPDNYIGALEYFGLNDIDDQITAMPLFRAIEKGKDYQGKGTRKDDPVGPLPDELKMAMKSFVLSVALRNLRGQYAKPNSMLVHIIRFKGQQNIIKKKVEKYFMEEIYNYIKNGDTLTLIISDFSLSSTIVKIGKVEIDKNVRMVWRFLKNCFTAYFEDIEESCDGYQAYEYIQACKEEIETVNIILITNKKAVLYVPNDTRIGKIPIKYDVWDLERLYQHVFLNMQTDIIEIKLSKKYEMQLPLIKVKGSDEQPYDCYIGAISGELLAKIYNDEGQKLIEKNVRSFLQATGKINKGIRDSLKNEPDMFMAYNNGISTIAESIEIDEKKSTDSFVVIKSIKGWQIVNGGQTTASIYNAYKGKVDLSKVSVQMKLAVIKAEDRTNEIVANISKYANSQNPIKMSDFSANDEYHIRMERLSRIVYIPVEKGKSVDRWFYERARGQYLVEVNRQLTPAKKKEFKEHNPKKRCISKAVAAKCMMCWLGYPDTVSKGLETNFVFFTGLVNEGKIPEANEVNYKRNVM